MVAPITRKELDGLVSAGVHHAGARGFYRAVGDLFSKVSRCANANTSRVLKEHQVAHLSQEKRLHALRVHEAAIAALKNRHTL